MGWLSQWRYRFYLRQKDSSNLLARAISRGWPNPPIAEDDFDFEGKRFHWRADIRTLAKAKRRGCIECRICRLGARFAQGGGTCVDVGANYGFISAVMAAAGGRVISFESDHFVVGILKQNASLYPNWRVYSAYVTEQDDPPRRKIRLDTALATEKDIAFIKVDTDGHDFKVLLGCKSILQKGSAVICVELSEDHREIVGLLSECGYRWFYETDLRPTNFEHWPANLVASKHALT